MKHLVTITTTKRLFEYKKKMVQLLWLNGFKSPFVIHTSTVVKLRLYLTLIYDILLLDLHRVMY